MRETIHRLKLRTGLKDVYQSKSIKITDRSLLPFIRMARDHLIDPAIRSTQRPIPNIKPMKDFYTSGIIRFQTILTEESRRNKDHKFKLGGPLAEITRFTSSTIQANCDEEES